MCRFLIDRNNQWFSPLGTQKGRGALLHQCLSTQLTTTAKPRSLEYAKVIQLHLIFFECLFITSSGQLKAGVRAVLHQHFSACFKHTEFAYSQSLLLLPGVNFHLNSGVDQTGKLWSISYRSHAVFFSIREKYPGLGHCKCIIKVN